MDFELTHRFNESKQQWDIRINGEIDIYNSSKLKETLSGLIEQHKADICIYCSELEYIDSTGLGALVSILKKVKQYQKNIHLVDIKPNIYKIFKITGLNKVFIIEGVDHE